VAKKEKMLAHEIIAISIRLAHAGAVELETIEQTDRSHVRWRGRRLVYFGGCDYLRLSHEPSVIKSIQLAARRFGINAAASRKTTGNHPIYARTEDAVADYFGAERAVLVSNGYLTNLTVAQGLKGRIARALVDERSHASLQDAILLLGAKVTRFKHGSPEDLERKLAHVEVNESTALLTDGMFSHNGAVAPLRRYRRLLDDRALLWVDDSHGGGILGRHGRGTVELMGISRRNVIQTVTFSKAFGVYGGAVAGSRKTVEEIFAKSRIASGNTPLPPMLAGGILIALKFANAKRRRILESNILHFHKMTERTVPEYVTPIVPVIPSSGQESGKLRRDLLAAGIYPCFIQYPGGPREGYFRFVISAGHSKAEIERLAGVLRGRI
jgi:7-keto-8-aminopelargonate synthetase-like enzyme